MNTQGTAAVDGPSRARAVPSEGSDADRTLNLTLDAVIAGEVATVPLDARLPTALHLMATTGVRHLPVVNRGWCEGLLLEIDLVVRTARRATPRRPCSPPATCNGLRRSCHRQPVCRTQPGSWRDQARTPCSSPPADASSAW